MLFPRHEEKHNEPSTRIELGSPNPLSTTIALAPMHHDVYSRVFYRYEVHAIRFSTFFVWAFEIVGDSWRFSMLLLYILWDDWPIFMISASNERLQQELKYTLLKPDCHSWWLLKMQSDTLEERYAIKFCFKLGKNATETYGMLQTAFWLSSMNWASVFEWHKRFKEDRGSVRDDERCGRSKEVSRPELIGQRVRVRVLMFFWEEANTLQIG